MLALAVFLVGLSLSDFCLLCRLVIHAKGYRLEVFAVVEKANIFLEKFLILSHVSSQSYSRMTD